jgi:fatty-acyl-CoA synthase
MAALLKPETRSQFDTMLDARVLTDPDDTALALVELRTGEAPIKLTRADFRRGVDHHARGLLNQGMSRSSIVLIAQESLVETTLNFWGALRIGATPIIFPASSPRMLPEVNQSQIEALLALETLDIHLVITMHEMTQRLSQSQGRPVITTEQLLASSVRELKLPEYRAMPDEIVHLQTSSGTTGRQKIVPLTHRMVLNETAVYHEALALTEADVVVSWMPMYHDAGLMFGLCMPLIQGIPVILMSPFDWVAHPAMLLRAITDYRATMCRMPNFAFNHLARRVREGDLKDISLASMRLFVNAAERVYKTSMDQFYERFHAYGLRPEALTVSYGMAETTLAITQTPSGAQINYDVVEEAPFITEGHAQPAIPASAQSVTNLSCGHPLRDVEIAILDADLNFLPERTVGEVAIRHPAIFPGYYGRPDLTEAAFKGDWFLSGDMGYLAGGELYITGRKKDLIIIGGKNIFPPDLEEIVFRVEGVKPGRAVVFGVFDERDGTEVVAVVAESYSERPEDHATLRHAIRKAIAQQSPVSATYVDVTSERWVIKTSSGKTARSANRSKWLAARSALASAPA